jgi:hypothetical protein
LKNSALSPSPPKIKSPESISSASALWIAFTLNPTTSINSQAHDAKFIIAFHNPSGDTHPKSDISLTTLLKYAGDVLKIKLLDHIIIGDEKFVSMKERMLL